LPQAALEVRFPKFLMPKVVIVVIFGIPNVRETDMPIIFTIISIYNLIIIIINATNIKAYNNYII
jgi:hypothetical protein